MNIEHLHSIRLAELGCVLPILTEIRAKKSDDTFTILELGSGAGWQAKELSERKFRVEAIDIATNIYAEERIWPITTYDGKNIPFPEKYFDVLFSSNVLEHIPHLKEFHCEMQRVLKSNGIAVHLVPSGSWRFWTNVTFYPFVIKSAVQKIWSKTIQSINGRHSDPVVEKTMGISKMPISTLIRNALYPSRHGETGNALSEIYYFSKFGWAKVFEDNGWTIRHFFGNKLFHTGHMLFGILLSCEIRKFLSYFLGSSCHIYVLEKNEEKCNVSSD